MIDLKNQDCLEAMRQMTDNQFDLAIVDPPYGIGEDGGTNGTRGKLAKSKVYVSKGWDKEPPSVEYFNELKRVSKNQIIWGANHFIDRLPYASSCWIVWDKDNGATSFADCELAYSSFKTAVRMFTWKWQGMLQQDMKNKEQRIHPTQKPVKLYEWLLDNYAEEGQTILDTHLGSGSIALACHNRGYSLTGFEIDKEYFDAAQKRLEIHQSQLTMF
jgi:site-specific DNA-methyltransferase (adenine-specific)